MGSSGHKILGALWLSSPLGSSVVSGTAFETGLSKACACFGKSRGLCCNSPVGTYQKICTASQSTTDTSSALELSEPEHQGI